MSNELGFEYYIVGEKDGKYCIRDIKDLVDEYYTYDEVMKLLEYVQIMGVTNNGINVNWFDGYIRRQWSFKQGLDDFILKFGVAFLDVEGTYELWHIQGYTTAFIDFVGNFRLGDYNANYNELSMSLRKSYSLSSLDFKRVISGVGFNHIFTSNIKSIPIEFLTSLDFDKMAVDEKSLNLEVFYDGMSSSSIYTLDGYIKSSRPVSINFCAQGFMDIVNIESKSDMNISIIARDLRISESFCSKMSGRLKITAGVLHLTDKYQLNRIIHDIELIGYEKTFDICCIVDGTFERYICKIIGSSSKNGFEFDSVCNNFIFVKNVKPKLKMSRVLYDKFMEEHDFKQRHGIDRLTFSSLVEFI